MSLLQAPVRAITVIAEAKRIKRLKMDMWNKITHYLALNKNGLTIYCRNYAAVNPARKVELIILFLIPVLLTIISPKVRSQEVTAESKPRNPFINKIIFLGNESYSEKSLKNQMHTKEPSFFAIFRKPRLRTDFLRRDIGALEAFYHTQGFFEAKVELLRLDYSEDLRFVDIVIKIEEGTATRVSDITFTGNKLLKHSDLSKGLMLKSGVPFNPSFLDTDIYTLKTKYFDRGHLAVSIRDSVEFSDHSVIISYEITPGPIIAIYNIEILGNKLTKTSIIQKELTFKKGDVFTLSKLLEAQRNLYETGLFTEVEMIPEKLDTTAKEVDISVRVRERKSAYFEVGFGVGNILGSRVLAEWGNRNLIGLGRTLILKSEYSFGLFEDNELDFGKFRVRTRFYRYDGEFHQRRLWGKKVLLSLNAFYEKDATIEPITIRTIGVSISTRRRVSRYLDFLVSLSHSRIKTESPEIAGEKSTTRLLTTSLVYDKRDFVLNPKTGIYRSLRFQFAGGPLAGDNDFYTVTSSVQKYLNRKGEILALRIRAGYAGTFGGSKSSGVPIENRYFAGGGNSVRGYPEASLGPVDDPDTAPSTFLGGTVIGGQVLLLTNAELRFPLPYLSRIRLSGAIFFDGGNVWANLKSIKSRHFRLVADEDEVVQQDYRYSAGFGIRYNTPVGPIRLDYGIPLKRELGMGQGGRLHISLGHIF